MFKIVTVVEGHGEVAAVPLLIRRIAARVSPSVVVEVLTIRTKRHRLLKEGELERTIEFASRLSGPEGGILILLDADRDCPKDLAPRILSRARLARRDRMICVVLAKAEYEAWFLAAAESIAGPRGIDAGTSSPPDPESIGDAKKWLSDRMPVGRSYRETLDQPALTAIFDLDSARRSASFDKLWRDVISLFAGSADRSD